MARRKPRSGQALAAWAGVLLTVLLTPIVVVLVFHSSLPATPAELSSQREAGNSGATAASGTAGAGVLEQQLQSSDGLPEERHQQSQLEQQTKGSQQDGTHEQADAASSRSHLAGSASGDASEPRHGSSSGSSASDGGSSRRESSRRGTGGGGQIADQLELQKQQAKRAKQTHQQQQQQQEGPFHEIVVHASPNGSLPRWPSALLAGAGSNHTLPGCADKEAAAQCEAWAARGDCDSNPGYMYHYCATSCGACSVVYLHGEEAQKEVEVAPGVRMPLVGYGTAGLGDLTADGAFTAIREGYRLIDSAQAREWYQEDLVGWGWKQSGIKREHLFLTTKLHPRHHGYWSTLKKFEDSLKDLQTPYIDLLLLHYPECWGSLCGGAAAPEGTWQDSWAALEQLVREGKLRAAGVSNFDLGQMAELVRISNIKPAVLQANSDLLRQNRELQAFCRRHGIQFQAYSSLGGQYLAQSGGHNPVLEQPALKAIARRLGRTPGQVALRWALQHGQAVLPRTSKPYRMGENLDLFSFDLTDQDMLALDALDGRDPFAARAGAGREQKRRLAQRGRHRLALSSGPLAAGASAAAGGSARQRWRPQAGRRRGKV